MIADYEMALAAHDAAFKVYSKARDDYRAMKIGDAEFLAAKTVYDAATAAFDVAFAAAEQDAPAEDEPQPAADDGQMVLL